MDRPSRPRTCPTRTLRWWRRRSSRCARPCIAARCSRRWLGLVASTVGGCCARVPRCDRLITGTGSTPRGVRYTPQPALLHVDVKLGLPDRWRLHGRSEAVRAASLRLPPRRHRRHTRLAYIERCPTNGPDLAVLHRRDGSAPRVIVARVLTATPRSTGSGAAGGRCASRGIDAPARSVTTGRPAAQPHLLTGSPTPPLAVQHRPARRPGPLGAPLQHSTRPLRPRRPPPDHRLAADRQQRGRAARSARTGAPGQRRGGSGSSRRSDDGSERQRPGGPNDQPGEAGLRLRDGAASVREAKKAERRRLRT